MVDSRLILFKGSHVQTPGQGHHLSSEAPEAHHHHHLAICGSRDVKSPEASVATNVG